MRRSCKLRLTLKSVEEEFKVLCVREVLQYRESSDPKVIGARVVVKTGRKWRAEAAVEAAEARMRHKVLVGAVAKRRASLGNLEVPCFDKAQGRERQQLIQDEIRASAKKERMNKAVAMRQQEAWTRWEQALEQRIEEE